MDDTTVFRAVRCYGYDPVRVLPSQAGYRNEIHPVCLRDGRLIAIILYKNEPDIVRTIRRANRVSCFMAEQGMPVRRALDNRILRLRLPGRDRYAAIYNYLPGRTIVWEAYTQKHLKLLGKTMADMHTVLQRCDRVALPLVTDVYVQILGRMERYFSDPQVISALRAKLQLAVNSEVLQVHRELLAACGRLPGRQVLHMDFVRSNVLFDDDPAAEHGIAVTGILDFEKTASGHPVFDIARTLAFLSIDCKYKTPTQVRKYFLESGYHKRGGQSLSRQELHLLNRLLEMFLLYDFYKFLRHNPYESLHHNEHFVRTRNFLATRGMIEDCAKSHKLVHDSVSIG